MLLLLSVALFTAHACAGRADGGGSATGPREERSRPVVPDEASRTIIFVYHRFGDNRYPSTNISLQEFRAHLEYLTDNGFPFFTLGSMIRRYSSGNPPPDRSVVITVDDGYRSFLSGALPLLKEFGVPATLFVNTSNVGDGDFLTWNDLKHLVSQGIEIGNHSHSHSYFLNLDEGIRITEFVKDVQRAQQLFREKLGKEPEVFAYPYGEYTHEMAAAVQEMGFAGAAVQHSGVVSGRSDLFALPRFPMGGTFTGLEGFIEKSRMWPMPVLREEPSHTILTGKNPPELILELDMTGIDTSQIRCFVAGSATGLVTHAGDNICRITSPYPLAARRTLYTITAPSTDGKRWYWYSKLWIRPEVKE